jgi:hypothetical protein
MSRMPQHTSTLKDMVLQGLVDKIKNLPPLLLEEILKISLKQLRNEIREQVIEDIEEETEERVYQEIEDNICKVVRSEIIHQTTQRCGIYSYYAPDHDASDRVIQIGKDIACETADLHRIDQPMRIEAYDDDSEGSSGDYDYPEEDYDGGHVY